jgi:hypothetical protein
MKITLRIPRLPMLLALVASATRCTSSPAGVEAAGGGGATATGGAPAGSGGVLPGSGGVAMTAGGRPLDGTGATAAGGATGGAVGSDGGRNSAGSSGAGSGGSTGGQPPNGTGGAGGSTASDAGPPSKPGMFKVFDQIPQFGIFATTDSRNYTPPPGVLMWDHGTAFATQLTPAQKEQIGSDLVARVTYHAQCDNYDRIGGLFYLVVPHGQTPTANDPRTELLRFITPFSDYKRGALATYVFPDADVSPYAATLSDRSKDVWVGVFGGSNSYDGDPCTNAGVTPEFKAVGFKYSLDFVSTKPLSPAAALSLRAAFNLSAMKIPVTGTFTNPGGEVSGRVTVIVSGHGANAGGVEYRNTQDAVSVNGKQVGTFSTRIDCASYEKYSPDGNPGIFRNNGSGNPRNWCPGALVASHSFPVILMPGDNAISLSISPSDLPSGSYYATSFNFTSP